VTRAGEINGRDDDLAAARREFGMWTWQSPVFFHMPLPPTPEPDATTTPPGGPTLEDLIARERPPAVTRFTAGALDEHAARTARGRTKPQD
jgi:hypothetical protein